MPPSDACRRRSAALARGGARAAPARGGPVDRARGAVARLPARARDDRATTPDTPAPRRAVGAAARDAEATRTAASPGGHRDRDAGHRGLGGRSTDAAGPAAARAPPGARCRRRRAVRRPRAATARARASRPRSRARPPRARPGGRPRARPPRGGLPDVVAAGQPPAGVGPGRGPLLGPRARPPGAGPGPVARPAHRRRARAGGRALSARPSAFGASAPVAQAHDQPQAGPRLVDRADLVVDEPGGDAELADDVLRDVGRTPEARFGQATHRPPSGRTAAAAAGSRRRRSARPSANSTTTSAEAGIRRISRAPSGSSPRVRSKPGGGRESATRAPADPQLARERRPRVARRPHERRKATISGITRRGPRGAASGPPRRPAAGLRSPRKCSACDAWTSGPMQPSRSP